MCPCHVVTPCPNYHAGNSKILPNHNHDARAESNESYNDADMKSKWSAGSPQTTLNARKTAGASWSVDINSASVIVTNASRVLVVLDIMHHVQKFAIKISL